MRPRLLQRFAVLGDVETFDFVLVADAHPLAQRLAARAHARRAVDFDERVATAPAAAQLTAEGPTLTADRECADRGLSKLSP